MNTALKRNIDVVIPGAITLWAAWYFHQKNKMNPRDVGIYCLVIFLVSMLIVSRITKYILFKQQTESNPTVQPDPFYNPAPLVDAIKADIYCKFCFRDKQLYKYLSALPDSKLVACWNYWNEKYFSMDGESMYNAINNEVLGWELQSYWNTLKSRFKQLNLI